MAWVRKVDQPVEGSSWVADNRIAVNGMDVARKLVQTLTEKLSDVELDDDSIVHISLQIDYLLIALTALAEAAGPKGIDEEYEGLCSDV